MLITGIYKDGTLFKKVTLEKKKEKISIKSIEVTEQCPSLEDKSILVTALEADQILIKEIFFPIKKKSAIRQSLKFYVDELFLNAQSLYLFPVFFKEADKKVTVLLLATYKKFIESHIETFESLGLTPEIINCIPIGLYRSFLYFFPSIPDALVISIGKEKKTLIFIKEKRLVISYSLREQEPIEEEIKRACDFLIEKYSIESPLPYLFFGESNSKIEMNCFPNLFYALDNTADPQISQCAIPFGISLDALAEKENSVQFRMGPCTSTIQGKRLIKKTLTYFLSSCFLALILFYSIDYFAKKKEKSYEFYLEELVGELKGNNFEDKFKQYSTQQKRVETDFPYFPNVPNLTNFLNWIGKHNLLNDIEKIKILKLRYHLEKYPKIEKKNDPYSVLIEIEFSTSDSKIAREFHDFLLKGDDIVNPQKVNWETQGENYRTSFYLKNKKI